MIDKLYTIYDRIAMEGSPPFTAKNDGIAMRHFHLAIDNNKAVPTPEDYRLYEIGEFDSETLKMAPTSPIREVLFVKGYYTDQNDSESVLEPIQAKIMEDTNNG